MLQWIEIASPATIELEPQPIPQDWILSGMPFARSRDLSRSMDLMSKVVVWDCTSGQFRWHYEQDETILGVAGEAFLMRENGEEQRFGPGDVGFFPAGAIRTWRVSGQFRKVAILRESMGRPLGFCLKAWKRLVRMASLAVPRVLSSRPSTTPSPTNSVSYDPHSASPGLAK